MALRDEAQKIRGIAPPRGKFSIVEGIIVILAVSVLAMIVVPQFCSAKQQAREIELKEDLRYLRTQIAVFRAQHNDVPPGYPEGDVYNAPTSDAFAGQLTERSDIACTISPMPGPDFPYGPYVSQLPVNPINGLATCKMVGNNMALPSPDGATGWIYKAQTQELIANVPGNDGAGTPLDSY
jgi:type II secretory pathway pseudopilin PulG